MVWLRVNGRIGPRFVAAWDGSRLIAPFQGCEAFPQGFALGYDIPPFQGFSPGPVSHESGGWSGLMNAAPCGPCQPLDAAALKGQDTKALGNAQGMPAQSNHSSSEGAQ